MYTIGVFEGIDDAIKHMLEAWKEIFFTFLLYIGMNFLLTYLAVDSVVTLGLNAHYYNVSFATILLALFADLIRLIFSMMYIKIIYNRIHHQNDSIFQILNDVSQRLTAAFRAVLLLLVLMTPVFIIAVRISDNFELYGSVMFVFYMVRDYGFLIFLAFVISIVSLLIFLLFALQYVMLNEDGAFDAISNSFKLGKKHYWKLIGLLIVLVGSGKIISTVFAGSIRGESLLIIGVKTFLIYLTGFFCSAVLTELYCQTRDDLPKPKHKKTYESYETFESNYIE